jgi:hypothetical protein
MATAVALAIVYRLAAATFSRRIRTSAYDHAAGARSAARVSPDSPQGARPRGLWHEHSPMSSLCRRRRASSGNAPSFTARHGLRVGEFGPLIALLAFTVGPGAVKRPTRQ